MTVTQCPKCQSVLKDDYGMVTCPSCGVILFIDMDGIAHVGQEEEAASPPESNPASSEDSEPIAAFMEESMDFAIPGGAGFESAPLLEPLPFDAPSNPEPAPDDVPEHASEFTPEESPPAAPEADFSMDSFLGFGDPAAAENVHGSGGTEGQTGGQAGENQMSPDDPLGLNDFANSEISQAKDGFLMFRVHVAGIDSKEIRDSIREAIVDQRFAWDAAQIMSTISKGVLMIDRLSPIKATILVSRIKRLPVQIRWEQYAITQAEAGPADGYSSDEGESY
jgi:hypothetical protein